MRPRAMPALTALMAAATLTLTSCGTDTPSDDKINGADDPKPSPTSSPTDSPDTGKRPEIKLPSDMSYEFDWGNTGNKTKDAVLSDTEQFIKAVDLAIAEQDPLHEAFLFYTEGKAAADGEQFIQEFVDHKDRITGFKRYYNAVVNISGNGEASLTYCEDQSKSFNKSLKTGKVNKTPTTKDSYVIYGAELKVNDEGVWVTYELTSQRGVASCQP